MLPKSLLSATLLFALAAVPTLAQQAPPSITDSQGAQPLRKGPEPVLPRTRQTQQSLLVWQQLTDKFPEYGEPFLRKGSLQLTLGDHPNALQAYS